MILSKFIQVKVMGKNIMRYKNLGYIFNAGDNVKIDINDIPNKSKIYIEAKCDFCDVIKSISYKDYTKIYERSNAFSCSKKCGWNKTIKTNLFKYGHEYSSQSKEVKEKSKETCLNKYGVEYALQSDIVMKKSKETCLNKYGVEYYVMSTDFKEKYMNVCLDRYNVINTFQYEKFKEKSKKTCLNKYGVEHMLQSYDAKEKSKKTCLDRYGVEYVMKSNLIKEKSKKTCLDRYGVYNYNQSEYRRNNSKIGNDINYISSNGNGIYLFNCDKGHICEINQLNYHGRIKNNTPLCTICNPIGDSKSIKEKNLFEYIKSVYNGRIIQSYRDGLEIDIYLPELKLGFEFNGLYWHSNKFKEKNYHSNKTNYFKDNGIRIIHIWEDDWTFKTDIVKSQISNLLKNNTKKIFARKCIIKEVDTKIARQFLDDHHIQSKVNSTIKLGLYFEDELVSIMTFDTFEGRKKMEEGGYNLSRFCNKINTNVVGGASKLLKNFLNTYNPTRIVSYADKDWSIGSLYNTLGFENIGDNDPDYKYIVENKRVHKSRYKKSKLKTELTEEKATEKLGILKIYDCGKLKFEKII